MAITITIQEKEPRDAERQIVFFTVTKDGTDYEFSHGAVPVSLTTDAQIKTWLLARKEELYLLLLRKTYPGADYSEFKTEENINLEAMQAWIDAGHKNKIGEDENEDPIYEVIDKVPYISNHPKWVKAIIEIDAINDLADAKVFLKKLVRYLGE